LGKRFELFSTAACRTWSREALRLRKSLLARRVRGWPRGVPDWRVASSGSGSEGRRRDLASLSSGPAGRNSRATRNFYSGARTHRESRSASCDYDRSAITARHGCEQRRTVCTNDLGHETLKFSFVRNTDAGGSKVGASIDDAYLTVGAIAGCVFGEGRRESMMGINQLRFGSAKPRVAQHHR
jgi:hypothetical protein